MKHFALLFSAIILSTAAVNAADGETENHFKFYGFVRNFFAFDTRESVAGTGDLFASVIAGGKARGDSLAEDVELAGEMIALAIQDSVRDRVPRDEGAEYEKYLPKLMKSVFVGEPSL